MNKISFKLENTETLNALNISYNLDNGYIKLFNDDTIIEFDTNMVLESVFKVVNNNKYSVLELAEYNEIDMMYYLLDDIKKDYTYSNILIINNNDNVDMYDFFEKYITLFDKHKMIYNKNISLEIKNNVLYYYSTGEYEISYNINDKSTDFLTFGNYKSLDTLEYLKIIELLSKLSKILL